MELPTAAWIFGVLALAAIMFLALLAFGQNGREIAPPSRAPIPGGGPASPSELGRCRDLGVAAVDDSTCRKAWAEHLRRFLETDR